MKLHQTSRLKVQDGVGKKSRKRRCHCVSFVHSTRIQNLESRFQILVFRVENSQLSQSKENCVSTDMHSEKQVENLQCRQYTMYRVKRTEYSCWNFPMLYFKPGQLVRLVFYDTFSVLFLHAYSLYTIHSTVLHCINVSLSLSLVSGFVYCICYIVIQNWIKYAPI